MSSKRHACNCDYCVEGRGRKQELQHGGTDFGVDYDEPVRYTSKRKRKRNVCAKSKTGEPCDKLGKMVKGTKRKYDPITREYYGNEPNLVPCCSRCGRQQGWGWTF